MKKVIIIFSLVVLLAVSSNAKNELTVTYKATHALGQEDKALLFMKSFYKWYRTQYVSLNKIPVVKMDFKTNAPYRIDYKETEKYLSILKLSGFFSSGYINYYRNYFKQIDTTLIKTKQNDGFVEGLDYDFIMHSQESESYLEHLDMLSLSIVKDVDNITIVKERSKYPVDQATYQLFYLVKTNNSYLIDKIKFIISNEK